MKQILLLLTALLIFAGCSEGDERRHPLFQKGERAQSAGNGIEAAECFAELLKRRPGSIYVHIKLASVYDELLNEPLSAVYHYRQYLQKFPDAPDSSDVRAWLKVCEKRCYEDLKKRFENSQEPAEAGEVDLPEPAPTAEKTQEAAEDTATATSPAAEAAQRAASQELAELKQLLEQYRSRHRVLMMELEKLRRLAASGSTAATAAAPGEAPIADTAANASVYRVQPGDTPGRIARKVYGKSSLYTVILRANPGLDERKLKPGMIIKLPPRPDSI